MLRNKIIHLTSFRINFTPIFMEDNVSKIKDRLDIADLVGSYMKLQRAGVNWKARCPFHNEKTPSFFVNPERQIWHCFGCNLGGDHFEFVQQIEGVDFPEALRILAKRAGIDLRPATPEYKKFQSEKTRLYEIAELSAKFFEKQLWHSGAGKNVLSYLRGRGASEESMKKFRLGYAPDSWNALSDFLSGRGYGRGEVIKAGMAIESRIAPDDASPERASGRIYDRFRNRVIFPVFDLSGQVVGFSGRIFDYERGNTRTDTRINADKNYTNPQSAIRNSEIAKYINTPQTPIYDKSKILYGLNFARLDVRRLNRCLVVEGNMDVIMSHQAGAVHAVATSGTALTGQHLKIIRRYTDNLDLCFDEDSAGRLATERGVDLALGRGFNVGVVSTGGGDLKDPADYVQEKGAEWAELALKAKPFMEFFFQKTVETFDSATAAGKKMISAKLLPFIRATTSKVEQSHWVSELAVKIKTAEDVLYRELAAVKPPAIEPELEREDADAGRDFLAGLAGYERPIAEMVSLRPELINDIDLKLDIWSNGLRQILDGLTADAGSSRTDYNPELKTLAFRAEQIWGQFDIEQLREELDKLIRKAKLSDIQKRLTDLSFDIKEAEKSGNKKLLAGLTSRFSVLSKELSSVNGDMPLK